MEPFFFIGYLIAIAISGLYPAIFACPRAARGTTRRKSWRWNWKGTPLHDATVVGRYGGRSFKDTSSVALNPIIKFTTLFGLLAVELAVELTSKNAQLTQILAGVFFIISFLFVYRSFFGMRIKVDEAHRATGREGVESV